MTPGIVYMKKRIRGMKLPIVFYGEDDKEVIVTLTLTDEKRICWIIALFTGYRYRYRINIIR